MDIKARIVVKFPAIRCITVKIILIVFSQRPRFSMNFRLKNCCHY